MKRKLTATVVLGIGTVAAIAAVRHVWQAPQVAELPNQWHVSPAGTDVPLPGDMPTRLIVSPDGKSLLAVTSGYHDHGVYRIDLTAGRIAESLALAKTWCGASLTPDGRTLFLSSGGPMSGGFKDEAKKAGASQAVLDAQSQPVLRVGTDGALSLIGGAAVPGITDANRWVGGLATAADGSLFLANMPDDTVYKLAADGSVAGTHKVGYRPYGASLSPDGKLLAVSIWGGKSVELLDSSDLHEVANITVGEHPCEMTWSGDGKRLFVACAGGDNVAVIGGTGTWKVEEQLRVTPDPAGPRVGVTPDAVALSADGKRLYVAEAGANCVAVADTSSAGHSRVIGFIPTGWYPSAVAVSPDGRTLYVGVGKGLKSRPNVPALTTDGDTQPDGSGHQDYIGDCMAGAVSVVSLPDAAGLTDYSRQVVANIPRPSATDQADAALVAEGKAAFKKIHHVLYIIRENRTYDQVLGDLKQGNGDPGLVLFGANVTPNAHRLASDGVLLDNCYCDGEVSEDGHEWCNGAYATDFKEKAYVNSYSDRGEPPSDVRLSESPAGYLWDDCRKKGVSYFSYGEYASFRSSPNSPPVFTGNKGLEGHGSAEWNQVGLWEHRDTDMVKVFLSDLQKAETTGVWPQFIVMHLGEDHTQGLDAKAFTPVAHVASNDQALGRIVEGLSHSRFWKDTAVLVIEDDAQDGPDHVDCHRTVALAISPYARRATVDHTHYSTTSLVRSIELMLGLPAMTEFDAHAMPLYRAFTANPDLGTYACLPAQVDLMARNPSTGEGALESAQLDFSDVDRADPQKLNRILWNALKPGRPMPAPVRSWAVGR